MKKVKSTPSLKLKKLHPQPPLDKVRAQVFFDDCLKNWIATLAPNHKNHAQEVLKKQRKFFLGVFEASPFLTRIMRTRPEVLVLVAPAFDNLDTVLEELLSELVVSLRSCQAEKDIMFAMRRARQQLAFFIACGDIVLNWQVEKVTRYLTRFADICVTQCVDFLLGRAQAKGDVLAHADLQQSGFVILALGKHGAAELNYSSDIDLVAFFEPTCLALKDGLEEQVFFVGLVQKLVHLLQTHTADGFVFRVDLRLRPDPGATQIAVSLPAAENYYETMGQNWERAAYIKARPIAGDYMAGERFLAAISPFIWRRHLDFAAIGDVHAMKRQIHAVRGHAKIAIGGHNIKLGRGGIREIEFFVQTQQLIAGGRDARLRAIATCEVLPQLVEAGWIEQQTGDELIEAYAFLRRVEHRLQMIDDEQTHAIPQSPDKLAGFVNFMGYENYAQFAHDLTSVLSLVQNHYTQLFEREENLATASGSLVFTGVQDDPETLLTLEKMGFTNTHSMSEQIRQWHRGRFAAMRSVRARELLTQLTPTLLESLCATPDPDFAFARFDDFITGLPMGMQLFSLFQSNAHLLSLIADIVGTAPRLSGLLARQPAMLDTLLDKTFTDLQPSQSHLLSQLTQRLEGAKSFEEQLDVMRIWVREQSFKVSTQLLAARISASDAGACFTDLATTCVQAGVKLVQADMKIKHGEIEQSQWAVIGMGKFGSFEMTAVSDLDLIMICDGPEFSVKSDGASPLSTELYYLRMARRLIAALTVPTSEGVLFEVDMRLRPSGHSGALIAKLSRFETYQSEQAWTWEHMALTRARLVAGSAYLQKRLSDFIQQMLVRPRDKKASLSDVIDMRKRMRKSFGGTKLWDLKHAQGGLVDMEFIAQGLFLCHAHENTALRAGAGAGAPTHIFATLSKVGVLTPEHERQLQESWIFQSALNQILKLCLTSLPDKRFSKALENLLCQTVNLPSMGVIEAELVRHRLNVKTLYNHYLHLND